MYKRYSILIISIVLTALLNGCSASFRKHEIPEISSFQTHSPIQNKKKVFTSWEPIEKGKFFMLADPIENTETQFTQALIKTNCCAIVQNKDNADLVISGKTNTALPASSLLSALFGMATLTVIPVWATSEEHIIASVKNSKEEINYDFSDSFTTYIWAPMIFARPFADPDDARRKTKTNLYNSIILQMKNDGLFDE